jgi:XTP/dITP diphosphohydrolase
MKLLVATRNRHKLEEIRAIFKLPFLELVSVDELPGSPDVIEDADTFDANARKKATELARWSGFWTLADDSGLEVEALGGEPGVYSARYAGEPVDYGANNRKLLKNLENKTNRNARFRCVIALSDPGGQCRTVEGFCPGRIGFEARGGHGFGYDPIFIPDGFEKTFAEIGSEEKNSISHRGKALERAQSEWMPIFRGEAAQFCKDIEAEFENVALLENEVQAQVIEAMLGSRGIPFVIRTFRESAFDGLYEHIKGFGRLQAPARYKDEILKLLASHPDVEEEDAPSACHCDPME